MSAVSQPLHTPVQKPELVPPPPVPKKPSSGRPYKWLILVAIVIIAGWAIYSRRTAQQTANQSAAIAAIRTAKATTGSLERWTRIAGQTAAIDFANIVTPTLRGPEAREMILMNLARS